MKEVLVLIVIVFLSGSFVAAQECEESDPCTTNDGLTGIVKKFRECKTLEEHGGINYAVSNRCKYRSNLVLICCPQKKGLKAIEACDNFGVRPEKPMFPEDHIINGLKANIAEFPFFAAFGYDNEQATPDYNCGGVLISES